MSRHAVEGGRDVTETPSSQPLSAAATALDADAAIAARVRRCVWVEGERTSADYDPEVYVELDGKQYEFADELLDAIVGDAGTQGLS